ncbi:SPP1 phage holin family protein [Senegalia massiliensis]|uniref:SPP1 phage holin family protein n=1 Tax=Senegalia massiliensis TaxID=1720316 RepID=UPI00102F6265|nr:SPP1 phage holin family protein [Senegalia massiliensis]
MDFNFKGVNKATWVRIVGLFLVLINQVSISFFKFELISFGDEQIYEGVSTILTVVMAIVAGWKNNSFTEEAQKADAVLKYKEEK